MAGIGLVLLILVVGPWILGIAAFFRAKRLERELSALKGHVRLIRDQLAAVQRKSNRSQPTDESPLDSSEHKPEAGAVPDEVHGPGEVRGPGEVHGPDGDVPEAEPEPTATDIPQAESTEKTSVPPWAQPTPPKPERKGQDFEQQIASRWLVWLGGVAIALGGIFLAAYAIENGLLGPAARTALGCLLGLLLIAGGEWVRRRPLKRTIANLQPDYVPQALSAAGLMSLYAAIYAGNALYDLYPALMTFLALAAISFGGVGISLLQGRFVAVLGVVGSFVTPALVKTDEPSLFILFGYLTAVLAASLSLVRFRGWWAVGYTSLGLGAAWVFITLAAGFTATETPLIGVYILLFAILSLCVSLGHPQSADPIKSFKDFQRLHPAELIGWIGVGIASVLVFSLVRADGYGAWTLVTAGLFLGGSVALARWRIAFDAAFLLATATVIALFALWQIPELLTQIPLAKPEPVIRPELRDYVLAAFAFSALAGFGGFAALWGARRAALFAGPSAGLPIALLAIAFGEFLSFGQDLRWAFFSIVLAAIMLAAATATLKYRDRQDLRTAAGLYAAAVVAALSLGFAMTLREAWLTVALSLQLPALAWIWTRLDVALLRAIASAVATSVLVRLAFNESVAHYPVQANGFFNWILYGYGVPCLAFFLAARLFSEPRQSEKPDWLPSLLEAGALAFAVLLITLQIRVLVAGGIDAPYVSLLEQSLQTIAWLTVAYALLTQGSRISVGHPKVHTYGALVLLAMAAVNIAAFHIATNAPVAWPGQPEETWVSVGPLPILNLILLAYAIPGGLALALVPTFSARGWHQLANISGVAGLALLLAFVTLEVMHWFQGEQLLARFQSDGENYAVSIAWLGFALAILAAGILSGARALRYASLAVLLLTILKVFLGDMSGLVDLYRVASFLGLGLCLVGVGYVYQRFVFTGPPPATTDTTPEGPIADRDDGGEAPKES